VPHYQSRVSLGHDNQQASTHLHHFSARRRMPAFIISDNAEQFKLLNIILSASIDMDFAWKFISSFAQWQGGVYKW